MRNCGGCGAKPGEFHSHGCDVERCQRCGGQTISCNCIYEVNGMDPFHLEEEYPDIYRNGPTDEMYKKWDAEWGDRRMRWTGEWPGTEECREYGFFAIFEHGKGWVSVLPGTPGSKEHYNRLHDECEWDQERQRYVRRHS